jgi:hypothetical protein
MIACLPALIAATTAAPEQVTVGAFVNDVQSIDIELHSYEVDITLWFRWNDRTLDPTATLEFINPSELWGHVRTNNYAESVEMPNGELYQVVRVQGRFSRKLPLYNYPFDRQELTVVIEDSLHETSRLIYVPDNSGVTLNPELVLPGYQFAAPRIVSEEFQYPTNFGDLRQTKKNLFSRVRVILPIYRPAAAYSVKLLLPIVCVVLCAALMLLLKPTHVDARIGIGITALLTIVALQITTNEDLPEVDYLVLMDKIYVGAYLYVITGLAIVVFTTRMLDGEAIVRAIKLQRLTLIVTSAFFVLGFAGLVASAILAG